MGLFLREFICSTLLLIIPELISLTLPSRKSLSLIYGTDFLILSTTSVKDLLVRVVYTSMSVLLLNICCGSPCNQIMGGDFMSPFLTTYGLSEVIAAR